MADDRAIPFNPKVTTSPSWLILATVCGLVATAIAGVGGYLWIVSGLPISIVLTVALEALLVGLALGWIFRLTGVRGLAATLTISILCGLLGAAYWNYSFYVRETLRFTERIRTLTLASEAKVDAKPIGPVDENMFQAFDRAAIFPRTGHHGYIGYVIARGPAGWTLSILHVALLAFLAVQMGWVGRRKRVG